MPHVPKNKSADVAALDLDAVNVTYSPLDPEDWSHEDPGNVDGALDELAACCSGNSALINTLLASSLTNIDGGTANSVYGGTTGLEGGGA